MDIELLKRMMDAFYQAEKNPGYAASQLPEGVTSSYIQYLDVIHSLNCRGDSGESVRYQRCAGTSKTRCYPNHQGYGDQRLCEKACISC